MSIQINPTKLIGKFKNPRNSSTIELSIIIPVYNQQHIIESVINLILDNVVSRFEMIIIDDGSSDRSADRILSVDFNFNKHRNLKSVLVFQNKFSKFETFCVDFGIRRSTATLCLDIQADMFLIEKGFDRKLKKALLSDNSLIAVSGRGIENISPIFKSYRESLGTDRAQTTSIIKYFLIRLYSQLKIPTNKTKNNTSIKHFSQRSKVPNFKESSDLEFLKSGVAGRIGKKIDFAIKNKPLNIQKVYIGQTIMRGPILFDKEKYFRIGGLDSNRFFQGYDEHDFCVRAFLNGFSVGYTPIIFTSPLELGSSRKGRSILTEILIFFKIITRLHKRKSSALYNKDFVYDLKRQSKGFQKIIRL
jgi:glycosyltransferase involved in cell wall biosynthesis